MNKLYREMRAEARKLFKEFGAVITVNTPAESGATLTPARRS